MHHKHHHHQRSRPGCRNSAQPRLVNSYTPAPSRRSFFLRRACGDRGQIQMDVRACAVDGGQWIAEATWNSFAPSAGDGEWPGPQSEPFPTRSEAVDAAISRALRQIAAQIGGGTALEDARAWSSTTLREVRADDESLPAHGLRIGDLAAGGVGALGLAFTLMGARVALACEIDPKARAIYAANVQPDEFWDDLITLDPAKLRGLDVITMGLDCRSLSRSGRGLGFADPARSALYDASLRLLRNCDAKLILIECASDLLAPKHFTDAERLRCTLRAAGYRVQQRVLDASAFGVPQVRERSFIVATRGGLPLPEVLGFMFPQPKGRSAVVADIMDNLPAEIAASEVHPHRAEPVGRADAPVQVGRIGGETMQGYRVYSVNAPGITITATSGGRARFTGAYAVPGGARALSPREAYRMQGVPEWATIHPVHKHAMRHAGNAVALPIAREFARTMGAILRGSVSGRAVA